jgi:GNAT superfamily N-acetyltransferase
MTRLLPGTAVRVRRGRRRDFAQVRSLVDAAARAHLERVFRRIVADLGTDVYVAESGDGEIVGLIAVTYARSLVRGGISAMLDGARTRRERDILDGLVAFAEERARKRGCDRLTAWVAPDDADLRATLVARGYRAGDLLVAELA